jgi:hypothetical protein
LTPKDVLEKLHVKDLNNAFVGRAFRSFSSDRSKRYACIVIAALNGAVDAACAPVNTALLQAQRCNVSTVQEAHK